MGIFKKLKIEDLSTAKRLILHIDSNEPKKSITNAEMLGYPIHVTPLRLPNERYSFGDYLIGKDNGLSCVVERKTWGDLYRSINDERFFRQIYYMADIAAEYNLIPFLFIEGSVSQMIASERRRIARQYRSGKIRKLHDPPSISRLEGAVTSAHVRVLDKCPAVVIRHTSNMNQTLKAVYNYGERIVNGDIGKPRARRIKGITTRQAFQISLLSTVFDISDKQSRNILNEYGSVVDFMTNGFNDSLTRINGIGSVTETKIKHRLKLLKGCRR